MSGYRIGYLAALCSILIAGCPTVPPDVGDPADVIGLELVADGFASPVAMADARDGSGRLFVADQVGVVHVIGSAGALLDEPFLDITDRLVGLSGSFDERGLLGLAFHPDYAENGRFFVYYSADRDADDPDGFDSENRVSEFRVSEADPDRADAGSERVLLDINKPQPNHNGGQLAFGPDGLLYISTGDGGGADDIGLGHTPDIGNAQDLTNLLGKILRIDVDSGDPYFVPTDNPFVDVADAMPEIWAFGLRNPWRCSFDSGGSRRLFAGDVGQSAFEEINIIERGGNYGWRVRERSECLNGTACASMDAAGEPFLDPIIEYRQQRADGSPLGISVIGGFVYRGSELGSLDGQYIFGDWSTGFIVPDGTLFAARENADGTWTSRELTVASQPTGRLGRFVLAFGQDADGELYVLTSQRTGPSGRTGAVFRIVSGL